MPSDPPYPIPSGRIQPFSHHSLYVQYTAERGRGVYTSAALPAGTVVEVGLLLYFQPHEIEGNALSEYTYRTTLTRTVQTEGRSDDHIEPEQDRRDGSTAAGVAECSRNSTSTQRMEALALGLGSLFNHGGTTVATNLKYSIDKLQGTITYTTSRAVEVDEELCIWYGDDVSWMTLHERGRAGSPTGQRRLRRSSSDDEYEGRLLAIDL